MPNRLVCAFSSLLFSLLLCASGSALGQVTASVAYNNLSYTLVDRDPNDDVAPWATFELVEVSGTAVVYDSKGTVLDECTVTTMGSCTASGPDGKGIVWFDGNGSGARGEWNENTIGGVSLNTRAVFTYSISPRTDFSFILDTSIHSSPSSGNDAGGMYFFFFNSEEGWFRAIDGNTDGDIIRPILVQTGDEPVLGQVRAYTDVAVHHLLPVPEPSTWAMCSAGLLSFLGMAASRRRRRCRSLSDL